MSEALTQTSPEEDMVEYNDLVRRYNDVNARILLTQNQILSNNERIEADAFLTFLGFHIGVYQNLRDRIILSLEFQN